MVIKVSEIPEDGLQLEGVECLREPYADPSWRLEHLALSVQKDGNVVFVTGRLGARIPVTCSRCLEASQLTVTPEVDMRFVPRPEGRAEELGTDDLETDVYDHDEIDLRTLVQGETELSLPMKLLCRPDCRGLCPTCGGNRNLVACACGDANQDPRWAPLRALADRLNR
jgi:uncharacterized protein